MPDTTLKPCPSCGSHRLETAERRHRNGQRHAFVICPKCGLRGPWRKTWVEAKGAWNELPRTLRWAKESPKVAGLYLCRGHERKEISLYRLRQEDVDFYAQYGSGEWAGPIITQEERSA